MYNEFLTRALLAGVGIVLSTGPLGCFIIWQRIAYFGDTIAHSALLGVAISLMFEIPLPICVFIIASSASLLLIKIQKNENLSYDSILGVIAHSTLSLGLIILSFIDWVRTDLNIFLFGDILAVNINDIILIWSVGILNILVLITIWKPLLATTINHELAKAEGINTEKNKIIFTLITSLMISISIKVVGITLVTSLLILPATTARRFSKSPESMVVISTIIGILGIIVGLYGSLVFDTPSGPSIIIATMIFFILSHIQIPKKLFFNKKLFK
ncbi:metal ABC transporter permease [Candidatus Liberibacter americanus]|uniref:High-affinity zinc uptake system membrane protein ZnuB n=1 Tax=Candidatus Liberibacter americanus str. Sao Paulo TaxID=1261131 RepID=U6B6V4_9HYPH|nr:iron chelate uptake ABC transporter family permease subunit [Candidatus Liberibacter americanus]AHA27606.1 Zinc ABC transporter, inner membrane permease protein ZnuB [Candidatus Liberibacter americanus str. Sao Paulo]EMS36314.1 zinc uptake ABC transporter permease protein [Candidatus Liberibacter americanus PW_SP]